MIESYHGTLDPPAPPLRAASASAPSLRDRFPPPPRFRPVAYPIQWATFSSFPPPFVFERPVAAVAVSPEASLSLDSSLPKLHVRDTPTASSAAQRAGRRYEYKVHRLLEAQYGPESGGGVLYVEGPWINFSAGRGGGSLWCRPDGLLIDLPRGRITVVEVKLRHTVAAFWALRFLYEPLIRFLFGGGWLYSVLEVVRWFDSAVEWPEPLRFCPAPHELGVNEFGVHILRA